ncbi:hypothetical protein [Paenibacillus tundrae]|uniref:Uncharacterized protein n=1 Tax=Paenibacillus tundrae TaxID=528187 RepID=A0ABT9WJP0_9BACL|nr:hypothetical protein [Paenibacillus tundrae]MDQ0173514.1 hypothetical protein [Paenibacillus tundrae]
MPASPGHNPGKKKVKSGCAREVAPGSGALPIAVAPRWSECMDAKEATEYQRRSLRFSSAWERLRQGSLSEGQFI